MRVHRVLAYLWTSPNTLLGLAAAAFALLCGGRVRLVSGVVEVSGRPFSFVLSRCTPLAGGAMALTLGHVVLGVSPTALDLTRAHERVHVRQYERWGPLFIPAYFAASAWVGCWGGDPYRDNPFEREAYDQTPELTYRD